ncbi:MAG: ATP-dependent DNA helicase RecG [bacterium]
MPAIAPSDPLTILPGVGAKRAERLSVLGLATVEDLLRFAPRAYEERGEPCPIRDAGGREFAVVRGTVEKHWVRRGRGGRSVLTVTLRDDSGKIQALWFHAGFLAKNLAVGQALALAGKISRGSLIQPEMARLAHENEPLPDRLTGIRPLYSLTEGLTQRQMFDLVEAALAAAPAIRDPLSPSARAAGDVCSLADAIVFAHRPASSEDLERGRARLMLELLVPVEIAMRRRRAARDARRAPAATGDGGGAATFVRGLPFRLSESQRSSIDEIVTDLRAPRPMMRMVVGDVGTGKTAVALAAVEEVRTGGLQCAMLAPTEILARQLFRQARELLPRAEDGVVLLTGSRSAAANEEARLRLATGAADVAIGTHALLSDTTRFTRLGLVVIDEQQRFGVAQRQKLLEKAETPHCLVLTATPIPRSLALLGFGDADCSTLDPRPDARGDVMTRVPPPAKRRDALKFVRERLEAGEQAFFVRPRIEDGDEGGALALYEELAGGPLRGLPIGLVHGRQAAEERDEVLRAFRDGELRAVVATSIVEVGLDVPGATVLWVEEAERFGLAQLHQLRGRIARRGQKGYCLLWAGREAPEESRERLEVLVTVDDGLRLAEIDLATRGPGELLGVRQSGRFGVFASRLGSADLASLAERAARVADVILEEERCAASS